MNTIKKKKTNKILKQQTSASIVSTIKQNIVYFDKMKNCYLKIFDIHNNITTLLEKLSLRLKTAEISPYNTEQQFDSKFHNDYMRYRIKFKVKGKVSMKLGENIQNQFNKKILQIFNKKYIKGLSIGSQSSLQMTPNGQTLDIIMDFFIYHNK